MITGTLTRLTRYVQIALETTANCSYQMSVVC